MPDLERRTISATEAPALVGASPYLTRWMLYQRFAHAMDLGGGGDARMIWGTRMQPLIISQAASDLHLEVQPNEGDVYVRRGCLGCTRDAVVICPDRGPGTLEAKAVFDYGAWMSGWGGGKSPPRHIEVQLQVQMYVGDGEKPFQWGVIATWVCGEMHYFHREPIPELWDELNRAATRFFEDVEGGREPNAFGEPIEMPLLAKLYTQSSGKVLDLSAKPDARVLVDDVAALVWNKSQGTVHNKESTRLKAKLLAIAQEADTVLLADGVKFDVVRSQRKGYQVQPTIAVSLKPYIPGAV